MVDYKVRLPLRIDWSEMDLFGHVNNVAYFKYIQASRVNYWELTGLAASFDKTRIGPILLSTSCKFIQPLFYPGNIVVAASMQFIKNTSFGIHHCIMNEDGEIAAEAHDVIVNFDFNKNQKVPITDAFHETVARIEGKKY
jgi:acyl-CoA thioester hydrolase